jgi:hypothetical protein
MKRRGFFEKITAASLGIGFSGYLPSFAKAGTEASATTAHSTFSVNDNQVAFYIQDWKAPLKIMHITDTHLWMDDARGVPFQKYSGRMAKAYNVTKHFKTGEETNPKKAFEETLNLAKEKQVDLLTLVGDIFSFPSEAAIEWALEKVESCGIPYLYTSGNHDWHYEGMEGSMFDLRQTWIENRLKPFYKGRNPLQYNQVVKGLNVVVLDNSTYEITSDQLAFFRNQVKAGQPLVLMVHIPLYAPGRSTGYGCGSPHWNAASDKNWELEKRPRWPEKGHTKVTIDFHKAVFEAPNLLGVFAGHVHRQTLDQIKAIPQFLTNPNATGAFLEIDFLPMDKKDVAVLPKR